MDMKIDADLLTDKDSMTGLKETKTPKPLTVLAPQLMSLFNTTMANNVAFTEVVKLLEEIPNLDFEHNNILSSALGIYYETSKRVQFRLGLYLNPKKEQILDCRRIKGDSFVMGNFFTILTQKMSAKPELGVKVVYEEKEDEVASFFEDDEDTMTQEELDALFGNGHLQLENDPNLVKHLMKEIEKSDLETQVNDTGLLAHAATIESNAKTLAAEGGKPLVELLEGKLQHNNAALVRQSAVLLKELTRMHPEIFSPETASSMVRAMGKWAPKEQVDQNKNRSDLVSSKSTVTNLAAGISSLMEAQMVNIQSIKLSEADVTGVITTLQKYPSPQHENVVQWMNEMVC